MAAAFAAMRRLRAALAALRPDIVHARSRLPAWLAWFALRGPELDRPLTEADDVPADPWGGQTLEWLTASPPSLANFDGSLAVVTSAEPLIDLREEK